MYNDPQRESTQEILGIMHNFQKKVIVEGNQIVLDGDTLKEEEKKFRSIISPRVEFNKLVIYPDASNVEWSGKFTDTNVEWVYSLDDSTGVYISGDLVRLNDSMMAILKLLVGYYTTWSTEWANKVAEDYKKEGNQ